MIILRTMGTIHLRQAVLLGLGFHDANYTTLEISRQCSTGFLRRNIAFHDASAICRADTAGTHRCWAYLARGWWASAHQTTTFRAFRGIANSIVSRCNTTLGKMGYQAAASIHGEPRTPHPNTNTYGDRPIFDGHESRQTSRTLTRCFGQAFAICGVSPEIHLQQIGSGTAGLANGGRHVR